MVTKTKSRRLLRSASQDNDALLPTKLPPIRLRHGQVLWLLTELGYRGAVSEGAFFEYIKSLRKLGIPFGYEKFQNKRGRKLAYYSFSHLMELAAALRVYHIVPDAVLRGVARYRGSCIDFIDKHTSNAAAAWEELLSSGLEVVSRLSFAGCF